MANKLILLGGKCLTDDKIRSIFENQKLPFYNHKYDEPLGENTSRCPH